jgi:protein-L-isoaspartate(D-aspartate) O-methyltransferase
MTTDFAAARQNMVQSQLEPNGIIDETLLAAFGSAPREEFVGAEWQPVCYCDNDVTLPDGRVLLAPMPLAKMIQALDIAPHESVLIIGGATGYSASILADRAATVYLLEESEMLLNAAQDILNRHGKHQVVLAHGGLSDGLPRHAPYDCILIEGGVPVVPTHILSQLAPNGRLAALETGRNDQGSAWLYQKTASGAFSRRVLFDCATKTLPGGWKAESFAL